MGRFYNQLGAIAEGSVELAKGIGNTVISGVKAYMKAYSGDMKGANKDLKEAGKQSERAFQGALYAVSGAVDFALFAAETVTEPFVTLLTLGMGNETMNGTFAEGNYELAKFRDSNKAQRHVNELGMSTGAEMYANDAVLDKVVTTTLAVTGIVGAILTFTPFAPIGVGLMAISAIGTTGWKSFRGAYEGGAAGMAAGVVSGIANSALDYATEGVVGVNLSYSYANGFGAGVSIGTDNKTQLGGSIGLNYNAKSGSWGATAGLKVGLGGTDSQGNYSNWVDAGVHVNNIGRESQSQGVSANIRGQYNEKKGLNGSLGLSYDTKAGYGATIGLTSSLGPVNVTPSWTVSEYGGLSSDVQYGFDKNLFNRTNNPDHSAANRNLLSDIFDGLSGLVSGVGRGVKSAWDGMAGAVGGLNGENLSNGWNAIKNALFGGGDDGNLSENPFMTQGMKEKYAKHMIEQGKHILPTSDPDFVAELKPDGTYEIRQRTASDNLMNVHTIAPKDPNHERITLEAAKIAGVEASMDMIRGVRSNDLPEGLSKFLEVFAKHSRGMSDDSLTFRSHFGDMQELHSMADGPEIAAATTKKEIMKTIVDLFTLSTAKDGNGNFLLPKEVRAGLTGSALHIIQDSFAQGHVLRNEQGQIVMFQMYEGQGDKHAEMDHSSINDPVGYQKSVAASIGYLVMTNNGSTVQQMIRFLDESIFPLADDVKPSGIAPGFEKPKKNNWFEL
ncbi:hypothetical protein LEP1GSC133_0268 [Leptospira borgpetersenii serovar Pomona str. 200901868]|uniref:Uncharacterized protein n=1 Tax=Leptospira borgpetersenii serovar Pomona str. 200901868 TaxID=1192866 RepID=M6WIX6_LEPBO|nr:hypothetical protein LEP1GSC133_0268 [Leptospira borgpetersenii serovar Pomona str. 200901868]